MPTPIVSAPPQPPGIWYYHLEIEFNYIEHPMWPESIRSLSFEDEDEDGVRL